MHKSELLYTFATMKKTTIITLALLCLTTMTMAKKDKTVTLKLVETSDVHGAFFPYDFTEQKPMKGTMARVSTYLKKQRKEYGKNLILLDNGDILQGQPTCYYTNFVKTDQPNIAAEVINYLGYDAQTFGNHDVETGHAVYDKWIKDLKCPTLGANIIDTRQESPYVLPYLMLEREGVKIAILGMLTPAIPNWLHENLWKGLRFEEMVTSTRKWVKFLKEEKKADLIIGLFHSGWEGGITTERYDEDASKKVAEQVDDLDVVFFGHDHTERNVLLDNGVLCMNPSCNAMKVAEATIQCTQKKGQWMVTKKEGKLVDVTKEAIDEDYVRHFQPQMDSIKSYVERQIGTFLVPIRSRDVFFGSAPFVDYIHQLQLEESHADISLTAPLVFDTEIKAGPVYMNDMFKLYRFENQIYTLRMTGREVRQLLELSYDQWVNPHYVVCATDSW